MQKLSKWYFLSIMLGALYVLPSASNILYHIFTITLDHIVVTIDSDTLVAYVIPLAALLMSSPLIWSKERLSKFSVPQSTRFQACLFALTLSHTVTIFPLILMLRQFVWPFISRQLANGVSLLVYLVLTPLPKAALRRNLQVPVGKFIPGNATHLFPISHADEICETL
jgi:hypothetical protein